MMSESPVTVERSYAAFRERFLNACGHVGRKADDITIVTVTKKVEIDKIYAAQVLGLTDFGESYVQEAREKIPLVKKPVKWHFIGHLQKNKANVVVDLFDIVQSVDSVELAQKINSRGEALDRTIEILLQIHYGDEESKHGFVAEELPGALETLAGMSRLSIRGLMTIPPFEDNPERSRPYFADMRELSLKIDALGFPNWESRFLSMGMTDDFEIAIEEGSNMIRIGRAIFGERV
ncbi:MAG: YggS family pyridoxal phosphate-dependent enzyme [Vulcanimicrobiota bacterium]